MTTQISPDAVIDITGDICPMTFVKVKLQLERMTPGQTLEIRLTGQEPLENIPSTLHRQGFLVNDLRPWGDYFTFYVQIPVHRQEHMMPSGQKKIKGQTLGDESPSPPLYF
ncbi:MAG: sulfurtransferase TusA family protein [Magnetococcus sp. DMHC-6]